MAFELPPLPYAYDALAPTIDAETMQVHHDLHHATYVKNANASVEGHADLADRSAEDLLRSLETVPAEARLAVRNNVGGHLNHSLFWQFMGPGGGGAPEGGLAEAIESVFGSFESFKTTFNDGGAKRFGSGWVWLVLNREGRLEVTSTANQDNPVSEGSEVLLGNDVWEHAYYLTYRNRRPEYLSAWWNVVDWSVIGRRFEAALAR
jgi:superoxide dismutase, Fe-Mn family